MARNFTQATTNYIELASGASGQFEGASTMSGGVWIYINGTAG